MSAGPVLVTGGAGFLGSHLVERLLADGREVVVLDDYDDYYDPAVKRRNLEAVAAHPRLRIVEGDIRDRGLVDSLFAGSRPLTVVHLAARAGVRPSIDAPELYTSVNLGGTTVLLEACRRHGVRRFVFGSSSSVYGNNEKVPFAEDDPVDHPVSPYAATKRAGELLCHAFHHLAGMDVACLRFFTVYGPRQRPEMAVHRFTSVLAAGGTVDQYGDGSSARDYTYVSDAVDGIVRAVERCRGFRIWNLGGSRTTTLAELVRRIAETLGVPPSVRVLPPQPGDVERTWADIGRARAELDWAPQVELDRGLSSFVEWFRRERVTAGEGGA